jgi:hypothetical protein
MPVAVAVCGYGRGSGRERGGRSRDRDTVPDAARGLGHGHGCGTRTRYPGSTRDSGRAAWRTVDDQEAARDSSLANRSFTASSSPSSLEKRWSISVSES